MISLIIQLRRKFSVFQKLITTVSNCENILPRSSAVLLTYCTCLRSIYFQIISRPEGIIIHGQIYRLFTVSLFTHAKEKASEAIVKRAGVFGRVCERREQEESSVWCGVQFSRDSTSAFNDRIKIRENRGL